MTLLWAQAGVCSLLFSVFVLPGLIAAAKDLVKEEFVEGLPRLTELLLRAAANTYPTPHRERFAEEFQANLEHDFSSRRLSGLAYALFTYSVARRRARALFERDGGSSAAEAELTADVVPFDELAVWRSRNPTIATTAEATTATCSYWADGELHTEIVSPDLARRLIEERERGENNS
jgi:hypothetical protein